ncbi:MAG: NADH-dependent [FeFe] hydrogenase, group A6 [Bacillota bacterium]|nr:NADH-dependent [FeFe] hydrogenase, group A6 [Bacillota bacterium]
MVTLMIDSQTVSVDDNATILDAARAANIKIPTLCFHPDQKVKANCRICVVEVEGQRNLSPACSTPVREGMVVRSTSERVRKARKNILELIFAHHSKNCLQCDKNGTCELQEIASDLQYNYEVRYPLELKGNERKDMSSPSITRDVSKCIDCNRCFSVCNDVQTVCALSRMKRGYSTLVGPAFGKELAETVCINCGQCVQACPVGALVVHDDRDVVWQMIDSPKEVVAQVAPAVRITIAEALGEDPGVVSTGRLVTAMKMLGFDKVFDTDFTADLTIMEEGMELLGRLNSGGVLPMITSCSPGWIKFCETFYPDCLPNLSSCKSPQGMFGAVIKTYYANLQGKKPQDIYSVSVMPCTAKKFEAKRPELGRDGYQDIDAVLTVQELSKMIKYAGINFKDLPETDFDMPFGTGSGAGEIFGVTGGVMEAALRTVYEVVTKKELENIDFTAVRGFEGIKEAAVQVGDIEVKVAVAHGLGNARKLMDLVREGKADYHFIEIMACPGGCIGGGGNPIKNWKKMDKRYEAVYETDVKLPIRKSHNNPIVQDLYKNFFEVPNSHKAHELLHTTYADRSDIVK